MKVSVTNTGEGPLCFFARDRMFSRNVYLHDGGGNEVFVQFPELDRSWSSPESNRIVCIPPGSTPVRQEFDLRVGREIDAIPIGDFELSFKLVAFGPYLLAAAKDDHSIGNGISAQDLPCGGELAFTEIRAEAQVHVD